MGQTMNQSTFTFRVDEQLKNEFTEIAKAGDVSGAQLLRAFMRDYVRTQKQVPDHDTWFREQVRLDVQVANAGDLLV